MALYDNRSLALQGGFKQRSQRLLGPIAQRFRSLMHADGEGAPPPPGWAGNDADTVDGQLVLRFPLTRRGYEPSAVDEYVADLEHELSALDRELAQLRGLREPAAEVASEIKRIGEQTSAVLMAAHEQREEILTAARSEAERCVAEATATARELTERSEARLRELETQNAAARGERARLLGDIRTISTALAGVADSAERSA
jgi:chromosome segregation ATPase